MRKKIINSSLLVILAFLILGSPSEKAMLSKLQTDFGQVHAGVSLSVEQLKQMGKSAYHSYLVCSSYSYSFGTIQVKYFGIGFMTFYMGSTTHEQENPSDNEEQDNIKT